MSLRAKADASKNAIPRLRPWTLAPEEPRNVARGANPWLREGFHPIPEPQRGGGTGGASGRAVMRRFENPAAPLGLRRGWGGWRVSRGWRPWLHSLAPPEPGAGCPKPAMSMRRKSRRPRAAANRLDIWLWRAPEEPRDVARGANPWLTRRVPSHSRAPEGRRNRRGLRRAGAGDAKSRRPSGALGRLGWLARFQGLAPLATFLGSSGAGGGVPETGDVDEAKIPAPSSRNESAGHLAVEGSGGAPGCSRGANPSRVTSP